jgi:hypothetical protein
MEEDEYDATTLQEEKLRYFASCLKMLSISSSGYPKNHTKGHFHSTPYFPYLCTKTYSHRSVRSSNKPPCPLCQFLWAQLEFGDPSGRSPSLVAFAYPGQLLVNTL